MKLKYCVYIHYKPNNIPFYIGKATLNGNSYRRAYTKFKRNNLWNKIVMKNDNLFLVQEVYHTDCEKDCLNFESSLIRKFGCIFNNTGTLANLEELSGKHSTVTKIVYEVNTLGQIIKTYDSVANIAREMNCDPGIIANVCRNRTKGINVSYKNRLFTYDVSIIPKIESRSQLISRINKKAIVATKDQTLLKFQSLQDCSKELGMSIQCIIRNAQNNTVSKFGWKFEYEIAASKANKKK